MMREPWQNEQDERIAMDIARECGFKVMPDGYVCMPSLMMDLRGALLAYYRKAQWALMDDGK